MFLNPTGYLSPDVLFILLISECLFWTTDPHVHFQLDDEQSGLIIPLAHLILLKPSVTMLSVGCLVSLRGQWFRALLSFLQFLLQKEEVMVPLLRSTCSAALPSAAL